MRSTLLSAGLVVTSLALIQILPPGSALAAPTIKTSDSIAEEWSPRQAPTFDPPSQDPFYSRPSNIATYANGVVLRQREVPIDTNIVGPDAASITQVYYKYTGALSRASGSVATIITPKNPAPGPPKVLAVVLAENAAALDCSPSYAFSNPTQSLTRASILPNIVIFAAIWNGWSVIVPDHEGSLSSLYVGSVSGHATLDAIRATLSTKRLNNALIAINGYSSGANGAAWAAQLLPTYAPELRSRTRILTGGGLPTNMTDLFAYRSGTPLSGRLFAGIVGMANAYPRLEAYFDSVLNDDGQTLFSQLRDGSTCFNQLAQFRNQRLEDYMNGGINPLVDPIPFNIIKRQNLGANQRALRIPAYLTHSQTDGVIPLNQSRSYVERECARGAAISTATLATGSHGDVDRQSIPSWIQQTRSAFAGTSTLVPGSGCVDEPQVSLPLSNDAEVLSVVGQTAYDALQDVSLFAGDPP